MIAGLYTPPNKKSLELSVSDVPLLCWVVSRKRGRVLIQPSALTSTTAAMAGRRLVHGKCITCKQTEAKGNHHKQNDCYSHADSIFFCHQPSPPFKTSFHIGRVALHFLHFQKSIMGGSLSSQFVNLAIYSSRRLYLRLCSCLSLISPHCLSPKIR